MASIRLKRSRWWDLTTMRTTPSSTLMSVIQSRGSRIVRSREPATTTRSIRNQGREPALRSHLPICNKLLTARLHRFRSLRCIPKILSVSNSREQSAPTSHHSNRRIQPSTILCSTLSLAANKRQTRDLRQLWWVITLRSRTRHLTQTARPVLPPNSKYSRVRRSNKINHTRQRQRAWVRIGLPTKLARTTATLIMEQLSTSKDTIRRQVVPKATALCKTVIKSISWWITNSSSSNYSCPSTKDHSTSIVQPTRNRGQSWPSSSNLWTWTRSPSKRLAPIVSNARRVQLLSQSSWIIWKI